MSLTGRVSAFFLATLALVLAGFGTALYVLTANYFTRRADERLTAAVETLAASAEVKPSGVEWEPNERHLTLGQGTGEDDVRWIVHDGDGRVVAESPNLGGADLADEAHWRSRSQTVEAPPTSRARVRRVNSPWGVRYDRLTLTAAVSARPGQAALSQLGRALIGAGGAAWLLAALVGRRLCRGALAPVRRMATAAATMNAADLGHRLELVGTGDELDDLGTAFNGLLGRLEAAFERQRRFTGDAAHQLSTPLTVLLGQLEVALRRERPAADYREALTTAHAQADRLRQIVEMLLFLAGPEADAEVPQREVVDLADWLPRYLAQWQGHPRGGDIRPQIAANGCVRAAVASALLGQLVDNLLDNACKYSAAGTPVTVHLEATADTVLLSVSDRGVGIAAGDLGHVFEPFFRSSEARRLGKPGVGLGLAVARRIADALDGTLTAESEPGSGSRFTLRLPVAHG
jgi:heavy metal sensor kinase